jgi:hypothetical protein
MLPTDLYPEPPIAMSMKEKGLYKKNSTGRTTNGQPLSSFTHSRPAVDMHIADHTNDFMLRWDELEGISLGH